VYPRWDNPGEISTKWLPRPGRPFQMLGVDFVGPFRESLQGNKYILTCICFYSRFPFAIPVPDCTAKTAARTLFAHVFSDKGLPEKLLTDRGSHFQADVMKELYGILEIDKLSTSSYKPSTNGRIERFHRYLNSAIAMECKRQDGADWDIWIPAILFAYRITDFSGFGLSPFEAVYGFLAKLPVDLLYGNTGDLARYAERNHFNLPLTWRQVHDRVVAHREAYDKRRFTILQARRTPVSFKIGDKVLLQVPPHTLEPSQEEEEAPRDKKLGGLTTKLLYKWSKPLTIAKKINENVYELLELKYPHSVVNCSRLVKYVPYVPYSKRRAAKDIGPESEKTDLEKETEILIGTPAMQIQISPMDAITPPAPLLNEPTGQKTETSTKNRAPKNLRSDLTDKMTVPKYKNRCGKRENAANNNLRLMSASKLREIISTDTQFDLRELSFYNKQIKTLQTKMDLPSTAPFKKLNEAKDRLTDLTRAAEHILTVNETYDSLWELTHYADELKGESSIISTDNTPMGCPERLAPIYPEASLPEQVEGYFPGPCCLNCDLAKIEKTIKPTKSIKEAGPVGFNDPPSSYTRMVHEPAVHEPSSFRPGTNRYGRLTGIIPHKYRQVNKMELILMLLQKHY
jgi:hypothetical protein